MIRGKNIQNFFQKMLQFGFYIPFSNLIVTYGNRCLPSILLKYIVNRRNEKIQSIIKKIVGNPLILNDKSCEKKEALGKRKIWFCWMQGENNMPLIVQLCLKSVRKHANGHEVIFLDRKNYSKYVSLPQSIEHLYRSGKLKQAHFADILRVYLLAEHGGLWIDATVFVAKDLPELIFKRPFFSIKTKEQGYFVSRCRWTVFCLGGEKANPLFQKVAYMFNTYLINTTVFVDYFMFDQFIDILYQQDKNIRNMIDAVPFNNENIHQLNKLLCSNFVQEQYSKLCEENYLFKLSWKSYSDDELLRNKNNYYHYLLQSI